MEYVYLIRHRVSLRVVQVLATVAPDMYKTLLKMNAHDSDIARTILQDSKWIWIGAGFVSCKNIALR